MPTSFPMSIPHAPTGFANQAALDTAFSTPINDLYAVVQSLGQGLLGYQESSATVTLVSAAVDVAATASVTFTLATQRRIRVDVMCQFSMASGTSAQYRMQIGYNTGSSVVIGSVTKVGHVACTEITVVGAIQSSGDFTTILLPAGTYTVYPAVQRNSGGSATDTARSCSVLVTDIAAN